MIMNLQQIENEALHLPESARAELTQKLLDSLDPCAGPRNSIVVSSTRSLRKKSRAMRDLWILPCLQGLERTLNEWTLMADEEAWRDL